MRGQPPHRRCQQRAPAHQRAHGKSHTKLGFLDKYAWVARAAISSSDYFAPHTVDEEKVLYRQRRDHLEGLDTPATGTNPDNDAIWTALTSSFRGPWKSSCRVRSMLTAAISLRSGLMVYFSGLEDTSRKQDGGRTPSQGKKKL